MIRSTRYSERLRNLAASDRVSKTLEENSVFTLKTKSQKQERGKLKSSLIGFRLREVRRAKDLSQEMVSENLGFSHTAAYNKYERGVVVPPPDKLAKLAELFGVSTDYLLGRTDDATPPMQLAAVADDLLARSLQQACRAELEIKLAEARADTQKLAALKAAIARVSFAP